MRFGYPTKPPASSARRVWVKMRQEVRFSTDLCTCGHRWSDHYQPRSAGKAACWAREHGLLDECHDFQMAPDQ